jgi:hypothetical protein
LVLNTWRGKEWEGCHAPLDPGRLEAVERALGVSFPDDYRECIRACHGGHPRENVFWFDDPVIGRMGSCLGVLLSFTEGDSENILETYNALRPHLPAHTIPFADDGGGDFMCFSYQAGESDPTVVYWPHGEAGVIPLADTFSEFIDMLKDE